MSSEDEFFMESSSNRPNKKSKKPKYFDNNEQLSLGITLSKSSKVNDVEDEMRSHIKFIRKKQSKSQIECNLISPDEFQKLFKDRAMEILNEVLDKQNIKEQQQKRN